MLKYRGSSLIKAGFIGSILVLLVIAIGLQPARIVEWASNVRYSARFDELAASALDAWRTEFIAGDGSLMDVTPLQTPNNRNKSVQINNYAVPRLTTEALSVQSAQVHTISGATYTSNDYRRSLQSAIDAARAAGITTLA